jgi:hypothetical protein
LFLSGPCELFHPLTPVGFVFPAPRLVALKAQPEGRSFLDTGDGFRCKRLPADSRLCLAEASLGLGPPLRPPRRPFRFRLPLYDCLADHRPTAHLRGQSTVGFVALGCPLAITTEPSCCGPSNPTPL